MEKYWQKKLTAFDAALVKMVESLTGMPCEPKNGGTHFFFEANYENHNDPEYILAVWNAIEGRAGNRLISIKDDPDKQVLLVRIKFYKNGCPDAAFIPKIEQE